MTDAQIYVGAVGVLVTISTGLDLTDNSSISVNITNPAGTAETPIAATASSPVTAGIITFESGSLFTQGGEYIFQPIVTYANGDVVPCNAHAQMVYNLKEVP